MLSLFPTIVGTGAFRCISGLLPPFWINPFLTPRFPGPLKPDQCGASPPHCWVSLIEDPIQGRSYFHSPSPLALPSSAPLSLIPTSGVETDENLLWRLEPLGLLYFQSGAGGVPSPAEIPPFTPPILLCLSRTRWSTFIVFEVTSVY